MASAAPRKIDPAGRRALVALSNDEGKTWTEPGVPFVPPPVEGRPGLFRAACPTALGGDVVLAALCWVDFSDPALPFFNERTEGLLDARIFLARSEDGGPTEGPLYKPGLGPPSARRDPLQEAWAEMERFSVGLPVTAAPPAGDILVALCAGPEPDLTDIR